MEFGLNKCAKDCTQERKISSHTQFNILTEKYKRSSGINIQVPRNWRKWGPTTSINERKIEEGIHQEIKNDNEIQDECQEWNYSNWRIEEIRQIDRKTRKILTM